MRNGIVPLILLIVSSLPVKANTCFRLASYNTPNTAATLNDPHAILYSHQKRIYQCQPQANEIMQISTKPEIYLVPNLITDADSEMLINLAKDKLQRSKVGGNARAAISTVRTSYTAYLSRKDNPELNNLYAVFAKLTGYPADNIEDLQVVHYTPGQQYKAHYDYHYDKAATIEGWLTGGNRVATVFVYLNDLKFVDQGFTNFPLIKTSVKPTKNMGVLWFGPGSHDPNYHLNMHAGMPPLNGEKWGLNIWIRKNKVKPLPKYMIKPVITLGNFIMRYAPQDMLAEHIYANYMQLGPYQN